jgi:DNA polymerase III delta subunit
MKTQKPQVQITTKLPIGIADVTIVEMVLRRAVVSTFKARNSHWVKAWSRRDVKDAIKAYRKIRDTNLEVNLG